MITAKMSPWFSLVCRFSNFQVWSRIGWVQVGLGRQQGQGRGLKKVGQVSRKEGEKGLGNVRKECHGRSGLLNKDARSGKVSVGFAQEGLR